MSFNLSTSLIRFNCIMLHCILMQNCTKKLDLEHENYKNVILKFISFLESYVCSCGQKCKHGEGVEVLLNFNNLSRVRGRYWSIRNKLVYFCGFSPPPPSPRRCLLPAPYKASPWGRNSSEGKYGSA